MENSLKNLHERGVGFEVMSGFEWETAICWRDNRKNYDEDRFGAIGYIRERLYSLAQTLRAGPCIRVISLRKSNK